MTEQQSNSTRSRSRSVTIGLALLVIALIAMVLWRGGQQSDTAAPPDQPTAASVTETPTLSVTPAKSTPTQVSDLPPIDFDDLPPEAQETIALIDQGGPFPYDKDGSTFQNREGLLPDQPVGYYAEYTVVTPGSSDRGARRIVAGKEGELYYTDDHYASFKEVIR